MRRTLGVLAALTLWAATGCAPVRGYPDDPEDTSAAAAALQPWFSPDRDREYLSLPRAERAATRDVIVMSRMRALDLAFGSFERRLTGDGNVVAIGGDLIELVLAGFGATTGSAATKAALAAASGGILGAQGAISKDLYYQRTVPALLAEMQANRAKAKLAIFEGLQRSDADYPLIRAEMDLDTLKTAGSVSVAIAGITVQAQITRGIAQDQLDRFRTGRFAETPTAQRIQAWLFPSRDAGGHLVMDRDRWSRLQAWLAAQPGIAADVTPISLVHAEAQDLEALRLKAIADPQLGIP